jgi:hypothetical protein
VLPRKAAFGIILWVAGYVGDDDVDVDGGGGGGGDDSVLTGNDDDSYIRKNLPDILGTKPGLAMSNDCLSK